jgi:integrase
MTRYIFQPNSHGMRLRLWSARIRLDGWTKPRTFALRVADKRVAEQKLEKLLQELQQEAAGIIAPRLMRDAAQTPIADHLSAFLADLRAKGRSKNTLTKYQNCIPKLCNRCRWVMVREITAQSFCDWRARSGLRPKTVNDLLGAIRVLLNWMEQNQLVRGNPLKHVGLVDNSNRLAFRRALSSADAQALLDKAPSHRAVVYLTVLYTGLRRAELNGLKWEDFTLDASPPCLRVPSSISKNRKASVHYLRPELVSALVAFRKSDATPVDFVFRGLVPRVPTFKGDLDRAGIPFEDDKGRRVDLHALRTTFGTMLAVSGVSLQSTKALMRHSDVKLTLRVYTDESHLPVRQAMDTLPSLSLHTALLPALAGAVSGPRGSFCVASSRNSRLPQVSLSGAPRHEKAAGVASSRLPEMERAKRLELSTSTLARWCSTN